MAFTVIQSGQAKAIALDKKGMQVEGYYLSAQTRIGKFKSSIYSLRSKKGVIKVWGNATIDSVMLAENKKEINPSLAGVKIRIKCVNVRKGKKGKEFRDHEISADFKDKLASPGSKQYVIKK